MQRKNEKKYYVLVPLPSSDRKRCLPQPNCPYIKENVCKDGSLDVDIFNKMLSDGKTLLSRLQSKQERNNFVHSEIITFEDTAILQNLTKDDVLYVTAHGSASEIGSYKEGVDIAPRQLAENFKKSNLSKELTIIKIMACDSAVDEHSIDKSYPKDTDKAKPTLEKFEKRQKNINSSLYLCGKSSVNHYLPSYAQRFQLIMQGNKGENGYTNLNVYGYLGEVSDQDKSKKNRDKHTYVYSGNGLYVRAKDARIRFFPANTNDEEKNEIRDTNRNNINLMS